MTKRQIMPRWLPLVIAGAISVATLPSFELGTVSFTGSSALAQSTQLAGCKAPPAKRRLKSLTQGFFKKIAKVDELTNPPEDKSGRTPEPNFRAAWPLLKKLVDRCDGCNEYEKAQVYQRAGFVRYSLDDMRGAIDYFQRTVKQAPNIPASLETQLNYQIAQLLVSEERYRDALDYFNRWEKLCPTNVPDDYYYFRAQTYYQMNDKANALKAISTGIRNVENKGRVPREPWYKLQFAIYVDREDYKNGEKVAEKLAVNYTDAKIISQLASIYGMNGKESRQVALLDALNLAGGIERESEFRNLAYLYMTAEVPFLAAKALQRGLDKKVLERSSKNLETLGVALTQSQDAKKAIPVMEEAAKKSDTGKMYASLAAV